MNETGREVMNCISPMSPPCEGEGGGGRGVSPVHDLSSRPPFPFHSHHPLHNVAFRSSTAGCASCAQTFVVFFFFNEGVNLDPYMHHSSNFEVFSLVLKRAQLG